MSEQIQPSPEERKQPTPLYDDCSKCEKRYQITKENSGGMYFTKQPECSYLLCRCPNCGNNTRIFCNEHVIQIAQENDIYIMDSEPYADDNIYSDWLELMGIELPKTYELTDRHEALIEKFGQTVMNMPADLLYDEITDMNQPKPHPQRWI